MQLIDPATLQLLDRALDAAALRHQAIAQNIANANVAGAKASRVRFEELLEPLRTSLQAGQALRASEVPEVELSATQEPVVLDKEMAALSSNSLHYQALVRALDRHMSIIGLAVQDGKA